MSSPPPNRESVIRLLSDGAFHSGENVAARMGVSRSAVWKHVQALGDFGLEAEAVRGKGYRLSAPIELLDTAAIVRALPDDARACLERLETFTSLPSTSSHLTGSPPPAIGRAQVCLAEYQSAGRGRRGREWLGVLGGGLCLSIGWHYGEQPPQLSALSLAVGVATQRALAATGIDDVALKWPNDLIWRGGKLGGILIELNAEAGGPAHVVTGIGVNVRLPEKLRRRIALGRNDRPVDLAEICGGKPPSRNRLAAAIIAECLRVLVEFGESGFAPWLNRWNELDALAGQPVEFELGGDSVRGIARGADSDGALKIEIDGRIRRFVSGEISPRSA